MPDLFSCSEQIQPTWVPGSFHINWGSTKANCHTRSLSRQSWSIAIWKQVPLHKIQRAPKHLSDIGSHSRWVGCHNTLFIQLIPFLRGVLQPSYQFSSWGGNSIGGINPLIPEQPQEVSYIICVTRAEAGGQGGWDGLASGILRRARPWKWQGIQVHGWRRPGSSLHPWDCSPGLHLEYGTFYALLCVLRFIEGDSLVLLWSSSSFSGEKVHTIPRPPPPLHQHPDPTPQHLLLVGRATPWPNSRWPEDMEGNVFCKNNLRNWWKGGSLAHTLLAVSALLQHFAGNIQSYRKIHCLLSSIYPMILS